MASSSSCAGRRSLAREADVIRVPASVAVRRSPDVALVAAHAAHESGQQVVALVRAPKRGVVASLGEDRLRALEGLPLDQRLMRRRVVAPTEENLANVRSVPQDRQHRVGVEGLAARRPIAALGEPGRDPRAALQARHVALEDRRHHRRFGRVGRDVAALVIEPVAERHAAAGPLPARRLSLHPGDHSLCDRRALELREDAQHQDHHPPGRGCGVEGLGGGAKGDAGALQALKLCARAPHRAREAIDAVDEQQLEASRLGLAKRPIEPLALKRRAGDLVGEAPHDPPAVLACV